jgi:hypothetical protein
METIVAVPPPVPALPDAERRTAYLASVPTSSFGVGFQLFGDSTDVANWLSVWVNSVQVPQAGNWTISSPSGPLATLPRPITDAVLTFTAAQTGTVQIVGARRPRRTSQFGENQGVPARDLNQVLSDIEAQLRELWDRQARTAQAPAGDTLNVLPPLPGRASMGAFFDSAGNLTSGVSVAPSTLVAGNGIAFAGVGPTTIASNIQAGPNVAITGTNPLVISAPAGTAIPFTPQAFNASGSGSITTGTISSGSAALTLAAAIDFANGQGIRINHAGAAFTLNPPTAASVTPTGTTGSTVYAYTIASLNATGGVGQSIANVTTATGNATLSATNFNAVNWSPPSGTAPAAYAIYGNKAGSLVLIGIVPFGTNTFSDIGAAAITGTNLPDWLPAAPQTGASLASWLITTVSSGAGTTALTLAFNAITTATAQFVIHDDTASLQAAITAAQTAGSVLFVPPGSYQVTSALNVTSRLTLLGAGYQGDSGQNNIGGSGSYNSAANITSGSGWLGTTFICGVLNNCINVTTNNAVTFEKFQITYPARAVTGITGIAAAAAAGSTSNNTASTFRDIFISGPDVAMSLANFINFHIDHVTLAPWTHRFSSRPRTIQALATAASPIRRCTGATSPNISCRHRAPACELQTTRSYPARSVSISFRPRPATSLSL